MCQGLACCECIYWNEFHNCTGVSMHLCLCSCWVCAPDALKKLRGDACCQCGWPQGFGSNLFCCGKVLCIP